MSQVRIKLTDELFEQVVGAVTERTGNVVGQKQINMIESRLTKRAMTLGLKDEKEYLAYFKANRVAEIEDLISILTVHHTYFFREFGQFEFLGSHVLPQLVIELKKEGRNKIRIWSAACSRGQETYSLYMFVDQYLRENAPTIKVEILGTDVDRESVKIAENGVFPWNEIKEIPMNFLSHYWSRGKGDISNFAKIKDPAKAACSFKQSNLMETQTFAAFGKFDIIFCRNVFIYFQAADVARIASALASQLTPNGYFFVGLSESLSSAPQGLKKRGPSIYGPEAVEQTKPNEKPTLSVSTPIRVLCVDDSQTIIKLLKSILTKDFGFEVVGTAADGLEAAKLVEEGLKFDVMTLDVHMPKMTGVEYLEKKLTPSHPPVVMLTSASRDNMDLALRAMKLGAKDYIEKPSLNELSKQSDEIRSKLRIICQAGGKTVPAKTNLKLEQDFKVSMQIKNFSGKLNVIVSDERNLPAVLLVLKEQMMAGIPCIVVSTDESKISDGFLKKLKSEKVLASRMEQLGSQIAEKKIYWATISDFKKQSEKLLVNYSICYMVFSSLTRSQWQSFPKTKPLKILMTEDIDRSVFLSYLSSIFVTPSTSFAYMSSEFFGQIDQKLVG